MTRAKKIQQAHKFNLDAAYREIEAREAMSEDMSNAYVDETNYAVIKSVKSDEYGLRMYAGEFAMQMLCI